MPVIKTVQRIETWRDVKQASPNKGGLSLGTMIDHAIQQALDCDQTIGEVAVHFTPEEWRALERQNINNEPFPEYAELPEQAK